MAAVGTAREKRTTTMSKEKTRGFITVEQTRTTWMESELFVFSFFCCANI